MTQTRLGRQVKTTDEKTCFLLNINRELNEDHCELFVRLNDPQSGLVETSRFSAAIVAVGYEKVLNKAIIKTLITHLKRFQSRSSLI